MVKGKGTVREQQIGVLLLALGGLLLVSNLSGVGTGWLWFAALGGVFLTAYQRRREPGLVVPGGVLVGFAAGVLLAQVLGLGWLFFFGLAGGFYLIRMLEPQTHGWAMWPAGSLALFSTLMVLSSNRWIVPAALVLGGLYLANRERERRTVTAAPAAPAPEKVLDSEADRLGRLAAWRARRATLANMLPSDFMGNNRLERLARENPATLEALARVLEPAQLERYGQEILEALRG